MAQFCLAKWLTFSERRRFQSSSLQASSLHESIADEHLALMMCQMIDLMIVRLTPYEELFILSAKI